MPLVRIDICKDKDSTYRREISRVVHEALIGLGVPENDRFQVISEHEEARATSGSTILNLQPSIHRSLP